MRVINCFESDMRELAFSEVYKLEECLKELAEHHNKVSRLFKGMYPKNPYSKTLKRFEEDIKAGKSTIRVVEDDEKIQGFCKVDINGTYGHLDYLIVLKESRGKGYGDELMTWAINFFEQRGVDQIEIKVVDGNNALSFYEKYGFNVCSQVLCRRG